MVEERGNKSASEKGSPIYVNVLLLAGFLFFLFIVYKIIVTPYHPLINQEPIAKPIIVIAAYDSLYSGVHLSLNGEGKGTIFGGIFGEKSNFDWAYDGKIIRVTHWIDRDGFRAGFLISDATITKLADGSIVFDWFERSGEAQIILYPSEKK